MGISPKGYLVISCSSREQPPRRDATPNLMNRAGFAGRPYSPKIYPGRARWQEVHVWDKHGKLVYEDAVPGLTILNGVEMDRDDNIYTMACANRFHDGRPYFNEMAGTVMKFKPKQAKVVSTGGAAVPLPKEEYPASPPDFKNVKGGPAWAEGAEWFYGGVGFGGFNPSHSGGGCHCWNSKFALDDFARSFAPEVDHYSVAVLDANGNLILRVGRYGNVDDGKPLVAAGGPPNSRSIGGDEVGLFHAAYVATHTDRRLFIADAGNQRIVSVKLDYHATERVPLKDAADNIR
jgi:hypothetical protein